MKTEKTNTDSLPSGGEKWFTRPKGVPADTSTSDPQVTGPYPTKVAAERAFKADPRGFSHFTGPSGVVYTFKTVKQCKSPQTN